MTVTALISEEEYLRTSYPDLDREFRDGEVIERSMPDNWHSATQTQISDSVFLARYVKHAAIWARTELRTRVRPGRHLIPDVALFWPHNPVERIAEYKPIAVIEVLSPGDSVSEVSKKLREYVEYGISHVWLADPETRKFYVQDAFGFREVPSLLVDEAGFELLPSDVFAF